MNLCLFPVKQGGLVAALIALGICAPLPASADGPYTAEKPLELRKVMQGLDRHMQTIVDGISREDWDAVAKTAPLIADHPEPPLLEKMKILGFIAGDLAKFKGNDTAVHQAARDMVEAATVHDGPAVIADFARIQSGCLACHEQFRGALVKHFYEAR